MKTPTFFASLSLMLFLASCGSKEETRLNEAANSKQAVTEVVAQGDSWDGKLTYAETVPAIGTGKSIILRNYDPSKDEGDPYKRITTEGDLKVQVGLFDGANELSPGKYLYGSKPEGKFAAITIFTAKGNVAIMAVEGQDAGFVEITSISGDRIEGRIDVADEKTSLTGTFSSDRR